MGIMTERRIPLRRLRPHRASNLSGDKFLIIIAIFFERTLSATGIAGPAKGPAMLNHIEMKLIQIKRKIQFKKHKVGFFRAVFWRYKGQASANAMHMSIDRHDIASE